MTHLIDLPEKRVLFLAVPENVKQVNVNNDVSSAILYCMDVLSTPDNWKSVSIQKGNWQIAIPSVVNVTEEQVVEVVEANGTDVPIVYRDYLSTGAKFLHSRNFVRFTAIASLHSLMEREKIWLKNPRGEKEPEPINFEYEYEESYQPEDDFEYDERLYKQALVDWHEAQSRTSPDYVVLIENKK